MCSHHKTNCCYLLSFVWVESWDAACSALLCKAAALPSSPELTQLFSPKAAQVISLWAPISHPHLPEPKQSSGFHKTHWLCSGIGLHVFIFMRNHKYKIKIVNKCYTFIFSLGWGSGLILSTSKVLSSGLGVFVLRKQIIAKTNFYPEASDISNSILSDYLLKHSNN